FRRNPRALIEFAQIPGCWVIVAGPLLLWASLMAFYFRLPKEVRRVSLGTMGWPRDLQFGAVADLFREYRRRHGFDWLLWLQALSIAVRRPALDAMRESERRYREQDAKRLYYFSMEFLMGRALGNNLTNLGLYDDAKAIIGELGVDLEELESLEHDAALGNGGLGRLAACFLDSLASLDLPGFGYGINYEFGLFRQSFVNGYQHERPDHWLEDGSPWLIEHVDE